MQLLDAFEQQKNAKAQPDRTALVNLGHIGNLFAVVFSPPLANGYGSARRFSRLWSFWIEQVVNLFHNPPTHLQQFFPDAALVFRHDADLSRDR